MKRYLCATIIVVLNLMVIATLSATPMMTQGDVSNEWGFQRVTLVEGLEHPWSMAWLPGGACRTVRAIGPTACERCPESIRYGSRRTA